MIRVHSVRTTLSGWLAVCLMSVAPAGELFLVPVDGGEPRLLVREPGRTMGSAHWAPDGKKFTFDTWGPDEKLQDAKVGVYDMDSGEWKVVGVGAMPKFSPDSKQIVCHTYNPNQIVVLNVDGTGREALLDTWGAPSFDPNGGGIFTCSSQGIRRFNLRTGQQTIVAAGGESFHWGYSVAPKGNGFCFASHGVGIAVALKDDAGTFRTYWKWPKLLGKWSSWSPDGKRIVAELRQGEDKQPKDLLLLDPFDDDAEPVLVPGSGTKWVGHCPAWSPDGKWILCSGTSNVPEP